MTILHPQPRQISAAWSFVTIPPVPWVELLIPARTVTPVDTTAAGDVFNGALLVALSEGRSLADAVRFAAHSASVSVTRMGAQASIPWRGELETLA